MKLFLKLTVTLVVLWLVGKTLKMWNVTPERVKDFTARVWDEVRP